MSLFDFHFNNEKTGESFFFKRDMSKAKIAICSKLDIFDRNHKFLKKISLQYDLSRSACTIKCFVEDFCERR